jgi:uncharacterized protein YdeI (BOF family)
VRRRAEDSAEPRLVRGIAGSAADQPGGQIRQRAAHQAIVQSHVMDEAIDRYVGGVKHVTMNIYIYTDISGTIGVTIHDFPQPIRSRPFR